MLDDANVPEKDCAGSLVVRFCNEAVYVKELVLITDTFNHEFSNVPVIGAIHVYTDVPSCTKFHTEFVGCATFVEYLQNNPFVGFPLLK